MTSANIAHALGLHLHQPPDNLRLLFGLHPWEAEQVLRCCERPLHYAEQYRDVARLHLGFSGILLEQLRAPDIIDRCRHVLDIPAMLARYREASNIEPVGMGYFHPIFPLIPSADWDDQIRMGREIAAEVFGRPPRGFWPSEMAFSMAMIPALVRAGYDYVVVDGVHVHPADGVEDCFRPYVACEDEHCIGVVARDQGLSKLQQSGLDAGRFGSEVTARCSHSARPDGQRLVTTWSDAAVGGWFREGDEPSGFFGRYFVPYMEQIRDGAAAAHPVLLGDYLDRFSTAVQARVQTGAWNVGSNLGADLRQWADSASQRQSVELIHRLSRAWWRLRDQLRIRPNGAQDAALAEARRLILEAQTSCFLTWGEFWQKRVRMLTERAIVVLTQAGEAIGIGDLVVDPDGDDTLGADTVG